MLAKGALQSTPTKVLHEDKIQIPFDNCTCSGLKFSFALSLNCKSYGNK